MRIIRALSFVAVIAAVLGISFNGVGAQSTPAGGQTPKEVIEKTPLKVTVVISRWQGDKRISNLPFTLYVNTQDSTSLRMQSEVPVPTTTLDEKTGGAIASFQMRTVGTSLDVSGRLASGTPPGRFNIHFVITDSQLSAPTSGARPQVTSFTAQTYLLLRDGETQQFTTATDKITGDVVKVDVTLNVLK
jgi:hypothetical protein